MNQQTLAHVGVVDRREAGQPKIAQAIASPWCDVDCHIEHALGRVLLGVWSVDLRVGIAVIRERGSHAIGSSQYVCGDRRRSRRELEGSRGLLWNVTGQLNR